MEKIITKHKEVLLPAAVIMAAVILGGSIIYAAKGGLDVPAGPAQKDASVAGLPVFSITAEDHVRGNPKAPVTIVEFSDLQCPYCSLFHPTLQQALEVYGDQVRWVYKHFPLDSIHPEARSAAEASECVWEQKGDDGFWKFADSIFGNQEGMGSERFREVAREIGADIGQYDLCVSSRKYQAKVEANLQEGIEAGVQGTPGSFVNGVLVSGAVPFEGPKGLKEAIDSSL
ncbi:MAG: DsbA family protein [Candidatus Wildermuthbacteria bacterium]|nr:DsbA family protein [Candidatus Wildermuthbacteria bacterium]